MSAGTLALTNKSDVVKGTGTTFTEMKAGDFIVVSIGGTPYTLTVKSITSDTQLTLISNFTGPTQSGLAWFEVPREAQSLITAALATQTTEALRGQNLDKDNWQQVFSVSDDITVTLKDGSQFTGPSWLKVVDLLKDVDIPALQVIAQQVQDDAESAGLSKDSAAQSAQQANQSASIAGTKAQEASASAQSAAESAATATEKADSASTDAAFASDEADRAKSEADRAAASNPANYLVKDNNLSDIPDRGAALINLGLGNGKGRLISVKIITASGAYTPSEGTSFIFAEAIGGGGGGGGAGTTSAGQYSPAGGGGGGGYAAKLIMSGFSGQQITIGAGGLGATGGGASGDSGGATTFAGLTAPGGGGGFPGGNISANNNGGGGGANGSTGSGGDINASGQQGMGGIAYAASSLGGGGGGNARYPFGGGNPRASNNPGISPFDPGCGGGGGNNNSSQSSTRTGASGSSGVVIIWEYA